jgi:ribosomal protein S18 acetylase RimI-like enzyme/catechol 2,3-dioxygenase-like lactoylglutathione lyase family enzyme
MIDHFNLPVVDLARSRSFYECVLEPLGFRVIAQDGQAIGFGSESWSFGIVTTAPPFPRLHLAFAAVSRSGVDRFHATAGTLGSRSNGAPGLRPEYDPDYYAAFVLDPDGHNIEAVCRKQVGAVAGVQSPATSSMDRLRVVEANLDDAHDRAAVLELTRSYARDPMGNGSDLPEQVRKTLIDGLRAHPSTLIFLALDHDRPVGIATCFIGFSTFAARALVNIHDLHVLPEHQRRGVARRLLEAVETRARELDCCKLTLEVQENNHRALTLYQSFGFGSGQYQPEAGGVLFRQKRI